MSGFRDHAEHSRYELDEGQGATIAEYRDGANGERALTHFETPEALRGQGTAGKLMQAILEEARASKRRLRARCAYALAYLERHPDAHDVMS